MPMQSPEAQAKPNWRAIILFYVLACLWSWPFFWWRDVHTASWNGWRLPEEIKGLTQPWGPGLAAIAVFYLFPQTRSRSASLWGSSWKRSAICFLTPVVFAVAAASIRSRHLSYTLVYYLLVGGFSTLGEEVGWRGFLQGALRPLGRVRGYLLLALMWEAWHFTSHTKGTLNEVISRLAIIVPAVVVITFILALLTERTGSVLLATAVHEWIDLGVDPGGYFLWAGLASVPVWLWLAWTWPRQQCNLDKHARRNAVCYGDEGALRRPNTNP
jgi:membrane protease YdiL (CAAX protease family)